MASCCTSVSLAMCALASAFHKRVSRPSSLNRRSAKKREDIAARQVGCGELQFTLMTKGGEQTRCCCWLDFALCTRISRKQFSPSTLWHLSGAYADAAERQCATLPPPSRPHTCIAITHIHAPANSHAPRTVSGPTSRTRNRCTNSGAVTQEIRMRRLQTIHLMFF